MRVGVVLIITHGLRQLFILAKDEFEFGRSDTARGLLG